MIIVDLPTLKETLSFSSKKYYIRISQSNCGPLSY
ncbi:hypothetical protein EVA_16428 [gut metagenome]|uniref:Uncharacterized protein n=1 Tax=gut metagenome TaxID=749906 RepID=J9FKP3_9ZZZZ